MITETIYTYTDLTGEPWVIETHKVETSRDENGKELRSKKCFPKNVKTGKTEWPDPRPLYLLDALADAHMVVVVEGPKCAEALNRFLVSGETPLVATANSGGYKLVDKTDFSPINKGDKLIYVWRDNDEGGRQWEKRVLRKLSAVPRDQILLVQIPDGKPEGWDIAEAIQQDGLGYAEDLIANGKPLSEIANPDGDAKVDFLPLKIAHDLIQEHQGKMISINSNSFFWDPTVLVWRGYNDGVMRRNIVDRIGWTVRSSQVENVQKLLKATTALAESPFAPDIEAEFIFCASGDLAWNHHHQDFELLEATPDRYTQWRIPHAYDGAAAYTQYGCSIFLQFLDEVFRPDDDHAQKIACIQQLDGLSLLRTACDPLVTLFIGEGANGKSVLLNVLEALVGKHNTSALSLEEFDNRFAKACLEGKLLNIVPELPAGMVLNDAVIKKLSSGDKLTVERKYHAPYETRLFARTVCASNHLPFTRDVTHAMQRRIRIVPFNRQFSASEQDHGLARRITGNPQEMQEIFRWALDGLRTVIQQNTIITPSSSREAIDEWLEDADNVRRFVYEECITGGNSQCGAADLHVRYRRWAEANGIKHPFQRGNFTSRLVSLGYERGKSGPVRIIKGLEPVPADDQEPAPADDQKNETETIGTDEPRSLGALRAHLRVVA